MSTYIITETGVVAEYARANYIKWESYDDFYATLYEGNPSDGGRFICRVPRGSVPSFDRPVAVKQASQAKDQTITNALEIVVACLRNVPRTYTNLQKLRELKSELQGFDARSCQWKE